MRGPFSRRAGGRRHGKCREWQRCLEMLLLGGLLVLDDLLFGRLRPRALGRRRR